MKIAIAVLLGLVSASKYDTVPLHVEYLTQETPYGSVMVQKGPDSFGWGPSDDYEFIQRRQNMKQMENDSSSDSSDDDSDDDRTNLQLKDDETYGDKTYFAAGDQGMTPNGVEYVRVIPEQYNEESPNKFMKNIIENYALE